MLKDWRKKKKIQTSREEDYENYDNIDNISEVKRAFKEKFFSMQVKPCKYREISCTRGVVGIKYVTRREKFPICDQIKEESRAATYKLPYITSSKCYLCGNWTLRYVNKHAVALPLEGLYEEETLYFYNGYLYLYSYTQKQWYKFFFKYIDNRYRLRQINCKSPLL